MRILTWIVPTLLFGVQICASAATILPGTQIAVRTDRPIDIHIWDPGQRYPAHVAQNVFAGNGDLAVPAGSPAVLMVRESSPSQMELDVEFITVNGARYTLDTTGPRFQAKGAVVPAYSTLRFRLAEALRMFD